jgi:large subunit ribosomal protein L21
MYAVIKTGGKQYKVAKDDVITVEKLTGEPGATINLDVVLMLDDGEKQTLGKPLVEGAVVAAEVLEQKRDKKILVFKKKRRKNYRRTNGHRQDITVLKITDILSDGKKPAAKKKAPAAKKKAPAAEKKEPAAEKKEPAVEKKEPAVDTAAASEE